MGSVGFVDEAAVTATLDDFDRVYGRLAAMPLGQLSPPQLLDVVERLEIHRRRQPALEHQAITELKTQTTAREIGGKSWADVLTQRLRISAGAARARLAEAKDLGPRTALNGEALQPCLSHTAAAQAGGTINTEHVKVIRKFFAQLPEAIDYDTREAAEQQLAEIACGLGPQGLAKAADRLAGYLNPDGNFSDVDRARRRQFIIDKQGADGMSRVKGLVDAETRATLDAVFAKLAAPGMCNPDDPAPCVDGAPSEAAIAGDTRTQAQRNHDALNAAGRAVLASGELGQHKGLPVTIIVSTTLQELQSGAGQAVTGGGSLLPMRDVIRLASQAHHYLTVFDQHTELPLYLGRARRTASVGQRIVLHSKERGCTRPGCTVPGYWCEVHHAEKDWAQGGLTNIGDLTLACGPDNRLATPGGWQTRKRKDGRTEWIAPPLLDGGQARVNNYHHPERLLLPDDHPP